MAGVVPPHGSPFSISTMKPVEVEILLKGNLPDGLQNATVQTKGLDAAMQRLAITIGGVFSAAKAMEFSKAVIDVRSKIETLQTSFEVLLGNKQKADALFGSIKEFAATTPMLMDDLASGAQTMLGFGIESEKVMGYLKALGDISMGDSQRFQSLTLAFSQMSATGKLMGQDLLQMINAGFNPLKVIAEKTGKSIGQLKDEMSQGKISAEMVQKAFISAASAGGQFNGMLDKLSNTQAGALSNLQGAWDDFLNAIGEKQESVVVSVANTLTDMLHHYEAIISVIKSVVVAYGSYKAALMAVWAWQKASALIENIRLIAMMRKELGLLTAAQQAFNIAGKANPLLAIASVLVGIITLITSLKKSTEANTEAIEDANKEQSLAEQIQQQSTDAAAKHKMAIEQLTTTLHNNEAKINDRREALVKLKKIIPGYHAQLTKTGKLINDNTTAIDNYVKGIEKMALAEALYEKMVAEMKKSTDARMAKRVFEKQLAESHKHDGEAVEGDGYYYSGEAMQRQRHIYQNGIQQEIDKQNAIIQTVDNNINEIKGLYQDDAELAKMVQDKIASNGESGKLVNPDELSGEDLSSKGKTGKSKAQTEAEKRAAALRKLGDELKQILLDNTEEETALEEDSTEKKLRQIDDDFEKREEEIAKKARELADENKKAGITDVNANGLTQAQQTAIDNANKLNEKRRQKEKNVTLSEEAEAKREYLKQWGTYEQQRLAITEEYAEKIRKAQAAGQGWRVNGLQKERDAALGKIEQSRVTMDIDWNSLFSGVDRLSQQLVSPMLQQLEAYTQSDEYKNAGAENQEKITTLLNELRNYSASDASATWQQLSKTTQEFMSAMAEYLSLQEKEKEAYAKLSAARKEGKSTEEIKELERQAEELSLQTQTAGDNMRSLGKTVSTTADKVRNQTSKLTEALNKASTWKGVEGYSQLIGNAEDIDELKGTLDTALSSIGDGIGKDVGNALSSAMGSVAATLGNSLTGLLSKGIGAVIGIIAQIPKLILSIVSNIKNFVTGILNSFSELLSFRWIDDLINSILEAIANLVDVIFHIPENLGRMVGSIVSGIKDAVGSILNSVTFGGFKSWFSATGNTREVRETTEKLTESNERLTDSVDRLKQEISDTGGWKAIDTAKQARDDQQKINEQTMQILRAQMGYHGAHHSNAHYWSLSREDYAAINSSLMNYARKNGKQACTVNSLADLYKLTPEEMDYIRTYNVDLWKKMLDQGKYDKSEYWENYADLAGKMEEITESLKQSLTQTSFDSLRSSFVDELMDMDKSAKDFASDFQKYLMTSVLNAKISDLLDNDLQKFYDKWAEFAESGNEITSDEQDKLQAMWDALTQKGISIRDQVAQFTGYTGDSSSSSQTGKSGGFTTMTQDQGTKLEGLLTSNLQHLSSIDTQLVDMATQMSTAETHLVRIAENTGVSAAQLKEIKEQVYAIKRDGLKMK